MLYYIIAVFAVVIDQISKWTIVKYMELYESIPIVEGWLHITSSRNRGAAFGMLQNQRWFFIPLTLMVAVFIIYYIQKLHKTQKILTLALAFILGGAIGNLIDRVMTGKVIDFIDVRIINFAIFNVADSFITVGATILIIFLLFSKDAKNL